MRCALLRAPPTRPLSPALAQPRARARAIRIFTSYIHFYLAEFEADAKAKAEELGALLSEREEEFYSYQNSHSSADDDDYDDEEDDEDDDKPKKPKPPVDSIDYADDEEEEDDKDEM